MLSLCMIVKNEGKNLDECLRSIDKYIEDIVIVDTGSTDSTKEIAKKYTDKVYDFKWCNDFSKARNFSISKASNDWILVLDADEIVYKFNKEKIEKFIQNNENTIGRIKRINPFEDEKEIKKYIERVNRLFNKKYFYYEGIIHEQLVTKDNHEYKMIPVEIEANHIGYLNEVINATNKLERNINLLLNSIKDNPNDPYLYYQIGKSYYSQKNYDKACISFSQSIELYPDFKLEYVEDLIESYGYSLLKCKKYKEAISLEKYKRYYSTLPDYNFLMGLVYMNNGIFEEAIKCFKKCIGEKEGKIEGINSYQPNYNIGVIYETLDFKEEAFEFYSQCGNYFIAKERIRQIKEEYKPNNSFTNWKEVKNHIRICIENKKLLEAEVYIEEALLSKSDDIEVYSMKSVVEVMTNRLEEAENTLRYALKLDNKSFDILYNMGYVYEIKDEIKLALKFYSEALSVCESDTMKQQLESYIKSINATYDKSFV